MRDEVNQALQIDASAPLAERTIDITTTGRRSGERRRIEVVFNRIDDDIYLTGIPMPQPRAWYLNLEADPSFIFHLKHGVSADLPATATPILDPQERLRILAPIVESLARNSTPVARLVRVDRFDRQAGLLAATPGWPAYDPALWAPLTEDEMAEAGWPV